MTPQKSQIHVWEDDGEEGSAGFVVNPETATARPAPPRVDPPAPAAQPPAIVAEASPEIPDGLAAAVEKVRREICRQYGPQIHRFRAAVDEQRGFSRRWRLVFQDREAALARISNCLTPEELREARLDLAAVEAGGNAALHFATTAQNRAIARSYAPVTEAANVLADALEVHVKRLRDGALAEEAAWFRKLLAPSSRTSHSARFDELLRQVADARRTANAKDGNGSAAPGFDQLLHLVRN